MSVFSDVGAAMEEAEWLADATRIPHLLIQQPDGWMTVIQQGEAFTGQVLEKFNPGA